MTKTCPCGSERPYADCCGPLHRGEARAATAEALMRSRYSAFARGEVDYLVATLHPAKRVPDERRGLEENVKALRWVGLRVLDVVAGGPEDEKGIVEFEASYMAPQSLGVLHERSNFVREDGAWYYVDGATHDREQPAPARQGRNEACACGSGKKFKRCCGVKGA